MRKSKQIKSFLKGKTFENSKDALWQFEKQTSVKVSIIYFSREFAKYAKEVRKTKEQSVREFLESEPNLKTTAAYDKYLISNNFVSLVYFSRIYCLVRKEIHNEKVRELEREIEELEYNETRTNAK